MHENSFSNLGLLFTNYHKYTTINSDTLYQLLDQFHLFICFLKHKSLWGNHFQKSKIKITKAFVTQKGNVTNSQLTKIKKNGKHIISLTIFVAKTLW